MKKSGMKLAALTAMIAAATMPAAGMSHSAQSTNKKDATVQNIKPSRALSKREIYSGGEFHSICRPSFVGNQRQYRKKCRQNPHHVFSKKHRANN